ncbi:IucA/IucC family protein [Paenibacillus sp. GCM10012307]|uniref:IucA/IucC family siderophore biosynthesis protein n=1 Tax=Paenibacillus roseus TaxID=2798579 RepID=A0A934MWA8_9BACL|nr:IucA/IucC family protein [Paenibacillus roseus]MBJ6362967.1 IucA/IucC family siderophore biosynthesis protein [Paenibacillus roseus]
MNHFSWPSLRSEQAIRVRRRIFRQLLESFLYERILTEPDIKGESEAEYALHGNSQTGEPVEYRFRASRTASFGRIRLSEEPIVRIAAGHTAEVESLPGFLLEIAPSLPATEARLSAFIDEVQQTLLKDTMTAECWTNGDDHEAGYDDWEGSLMEGHPYHPCYKSRIGFTLRENKAYGPEFKPDLRLIWVAVYRSVASLAMSESLSYEAFMQQELGENGLCRFNAMLQEKGCKPEDFVLLPVHPWQWERIIAVECAEQLRTEELIYLGEGEDSYRPQQSIRTLANRTAGNKAYVKLPLNIVNTSSGRILARHTIMNAAPISDWLGRIAATDPFLRDKHRVVLLKEVLGVSYLHNKLPNLLEQKIYGSLGAIWRESLHPYLTNEEQAYPFNIVTHTDTEGVPFIHPWVQEHGVEQWLSTLLQASVVPLIHLLIVHGASLESHAQNMILIAKNGLAERIALKDFHDGVRYMPTLANSLGYPKIEYPPANHQRPNRNSFIEKERPEELRDFLLDALLVINLSELAFFLSRHYGFAEQRFWEAVAETIIGYQQQFPEFKERFEQFDLFAPEIEVEQLARRRVDDSGDCVHTVSNPLFQYRPMIAGRSREHA